MGRIGKSTISSTDSLHVSRRVMEYFELVKGDELLWYPPEEDFGATAELIAVKIIRFGERPQEPPATPKNIAVTPTLP